MAAWRSSPVPAEASGVGAAGGWAVRRRAWGGGSALVLVLTVAHQPAEIERVANILGAAWRELSGTVRHAR